MVNPIVVEVTRGALVESRHRGALAVVDKTGASIHRIGDINAAVFPRSSIKALQALILVESGAAEALDLPDTALALSCSSHNGEAPHVAVATDMLARIGLTQDALACGPQWPRRYIDRAALRARGENPQPIHNNCSGKHAGFLCAMHHLGIAHSGYAQPDHPFMQQLGDIIADMTGVRQSAGVCGIDGCAIPTCALPLHNLAHAFARFVSGHGLGAQRARAARRLLDACMQNPFMVAGTDRFCTDVMAACPGRVFVKTGAEGVFCAALPEQGLGLALKCDDGATRAAEAMMAHALRLFMPVNTAEDTVLKRFCDKPVKNWNGTTVGRLNCTITFDG